MKDIDKKLRKHVLRAKLFQEKEKVFVKEPWQGYCDNQDHPLFTIKVDYKRKVSSCYYCSKTWILEE